MRAIILALSFSLLSIPARAQIGLYTSPDGDNDNCSGIGNGYSDIYIVVTGEWSGARFFIPSDCIALYTIEPMNGATFTGDLDHGFQMTFADCTSGAPMAVARYTAIGHGTPCCEAMLAAHPTATSGMVELIDCEGNIAPVTWSARVHMPNLPYEICPDLPLFSPPPRTPFPLNGADDVPLSLTLTWAVDDPYGNCLYTSGRRANVYLGTSPNPPVFAGDLGEMQLNVGPLQPSTTYYWKVWVHNYGAQVTGPIWSFRTASPVATTPTTWGRVKALYR